MNRYTKPVFNGISTKHDRKKEAEMLKVLSKPSSGVVSIAYGYGEIVWIDECSNIINPELMKKIIENLSEVDKRLDKKHSVL